MNTLIVLPRQDNIKGKVIGASDPIDKNDVSTFCHNKCTNVYVYSLILNFLQETA